jgi:uncharacterized protein Yka (UPF0111/DUF47 family)
VLRAVFDCIDVIQRGSEMAAPNPDDEMKNLAERIRIMTEQLKKIMASGGNPNSQMTQKLRNAISDAADEIDRIHRTLPN